MYLLCKFYGRTGGGLWEHVRKSTLKIPEFQGFGHLSQRYVLEKQRKRSMAYAYKTD